MYWRKISAGAWEHGACVGTCVRILLSHSAYLCKRCGRHISGPQGHTERNTLWKGRVSLGNCVFRTIILYLLLIAGLRLSGKRQIGELEPIELVLTLLISDLASVPMQDFGLPLLNGVVPILALIALSTLFSCASLRNVRFRSLVCGEPALVIRDGRIRQEVMHHNRLTLDELMEELRGQGVLDINTVKYAVLETSGHLSVLLRADRQPLTAQQMAAAVEDDVLLPTVVINDGRVMAENLRQAGRDENWLRQQLQKRKIKHPRDVFLLSVDEGGNVVCQLKEDAR